MKNLTNVQCASFQLMIVVLWKDTLWENIREKYRSSVTSATTIALQQANCRNIREHTLRRNLSGATNASIPAMIVAIWKFTRWGSIRGKKCLSVTSATTLVLQQNNCSNTSERTQGRNLSSAASATNVSHGRGIYQNISKSTSPQIESWFCFDFQTNFFPNLLTPSSPMDEYISNKLAMVWWMRLQKTFEFIDFGLILGCQ